MSYRIQISPEAQEEILAARKWYEEQQPGLGKDFANTVKDHINTLRFDTVEHRIVFDNVRRILVKRFPYVIYYSRNNNNRTVSIMAVLHERQNRK